MQELSALDKLRNRTNHLKAELVESQGENTALKRLFSTVLDDAYSPLTMATDDLLGGLAGIALWRGGSWLYSKAAQNDPGKPAGFLQRNSWLNDLLHAGVAASTYAANLAIPYEAPLSLGREVVRRASATQLIFAIDAAGAKLWTYLTAPKAPAAPQNLPPTPPPAQTPAKK